MIVVPQGTVLHNNGNTDIPVFLLGYLLKDGKGFITEQGKVLFKAGETRRENLSLYGCLLQGGITSRENPSLEDAHRTNDLQDIGLFYVPSHTKYYRDPDKETITSETLKFSGEIV